MNVRAGDGTAVAGDRGRLVGPDVVRAVALIGVAVMNYHGYLIHRGGSRGSGAGLDAFFDPWTGPLATRFAATFVLVAGVGVTLLTRRSIGDPAAVRQRRWTLARRGLVLYGGGLLLDMVWNGTILPYYGAMFVLAAVLFTASTITVAAVGMGAAIAGAAIEWWRLEHSLDGHDTSWLTAPRSGSPRGVLFDVAVNGTHPLLPWLTFFCAGIVLGRFLGRDAWRVLCLGGGAMLYGLATMISGAVGSGERAVVLGSTDPFDRGLLFTASALGTALIAFAAVSWLAEQFTGSLIVELLRHAGAMTLTLYVAHALAFNLVVDWLGWVEPGGLGTALGFAAAFWVVAIIIGAGYHHRFGIGPLEAVYRRLGG